VACFHFALAVLFFLYLMMNADLAATIHLFCVAILSIVAVVSISSLTSVGDYCFQEDTSYGVT
jgi:hypothetical protein